VKLRATTMGDLEGLGSAIVLLEQEGREEREERRVVQ